METLKILVVDDEEHTRLGYAEILKMGGYEVDLAVDGLDGLFKAEKGGYDLIITDLRMPKLNGLEFLEKMKERNIEAKVIVITAFGSYKSFKEAENVGACVYLNKPVRAADLDAAITELFRK